jgi:transcription termination factor Rho
MSVLDRASLEASPLADLHAIASELSIDGYRRLRRADLIDAIIARQEGTERPAADDEVAAEASGETDSGVDESGDGAEATAGGRRRRGRRGGRGRGAARENGAEEAADADAEPEPEDEAVRRSEEDEEERVEPAEPAEPAEPRARRSRRGGGRAAAAAVAEEESDAETDEREDELVEGVVELLANGSGFLRVAPPDPSDDDVYISAAQVKRCELVGGDRVSGPKRAPRRSERFASLIRVDAINGRPASELADGVRYDDLAATFPTERFRLGSDDPTLKAIEWLTPFGRGSRVTITGGPWAGKSHALRRLADTLATDESINLFIALAGVRPEEISDWGSAAVAPAGAISFAASIDAQDHAVELVVDQARRIAARGGDAVVLIDTLDSLHPPTARKVMAAARNIVDGGSLTVIAASTRAIGGETTVIALDPTLTSTGRFPALDLVASGTLRPDLLVGAAGAQAIADARAEARG